MKIAHVINSLGRGGAERLLVETIPEYCRAGHDVSLIVLTRNREEPQYREELEVAGIKIITLSNGSVRSPRLIPALRRAIVSGKFDLLHVHIFPAQYFVPLALMCVRNKPLLVFTEHNIANKRIKQPLLMPVERYIYSQYDQLIAITPEIKNIFQRWTGRADRWVYIPNGVSLAKIRNAQPVNRFSLLEDLNIEKEAQLLGMFSRFNYPKNQILLVESLQYLPEHFHLLLAGEGEEQQKVKERALTLSLSQRVHFLGFRNDVASLMKTLDLVAMATFFEGMSGVALEALASGTPFLGANVPGILEVVPDKRFLFETTNPKDFAEKAMKILNDPVLAASMSNKGLYHVGQFDMSNMINSYLALYENVFNSTQKSG